MTDSPAGPASSKPCSPAPIVSKKQIIIHYNPQRPAKRIRFLSPSMAIDLDDSSAADEDDDSQHLSAKQEPVLREAADALLDAVEIDDSHILLPKPRADCKEPTRSLLAFTPVFQRAASRFSSAMAKVQAAWLNRFFADQPSAFQRPVTPPSPIRLPEEYAKIRNEEAEKRFREEEEKKKKKKKEEAEDCELLKRTRHSSERGAAMSREEPVIEYDIVGTGQTVHSSKQTSKKETSIKLKLRRKRKPQVRRSKKLAVNHNKWPQLPHDDNKSYGS
ncbi:hypothetical protein BD289DRAFT_506062 [Coniella lustricola]|uniref:Uncharacterized protein n=1 Tax=Coniella lustricola TaxID=2025994 RepID=A0A2T3A7X6_9PEZI|nr:hypothetical protein BD289DRAFT_506062 [Coniella lustricola]